MDTNEISLFIYFVRFFTEKVWKLFFAEEFILSKITQFIFSLKMKQVKTHKSL